MSREPLHLLGVGIYTRAEAARLLHLSPGRVSSWVRGYRYRWGPRTSRRAGSQPPVINTDIPSIDGALSISFLELMELRVVRQFRHRGIPLQTVRVAWHHASQAFGSTHPFADHRVFVDGLKIFAAAGNSGNPDLLEISSRRSPFQLNAGPIFERSLQEIDFDEGGLARRWWPRGQTVPIVLDPQIAFGAPTVAGTRVSTQTLALYAKGNRVDEVAYALRLAPEQVEAAVQFETQLARAA